jgi:cobalt-zinc-cadmium efflux system outer membrane protein
MTKNIIIAAIVFFFFMMPESVSHATDYSSAREAAEDGSTDVVGTFLAFADQLSESSDTEEIDSGFDMAQYYQMASSRDPLADLLRIYPVATEDHVTTLQSMEDGDILEMLSGEPDENEIIAVLLARSPRLARAKNAWRASLNRYPQVDFVQDLISRYSAFTEGMTLGIGREYQQDMIQMHYQGPGESGMMSLRGRVAELDVETAYRDYLREGSSLIADARTLLAQIRNKEDLISINSASVSRLASLRSVVEAQYMAGTQSFSDLIRIGTELKSRRDTLESLTSMRDGLKGQLAAMLDLPAAEIGSIGWCDDAGISLDDESPGDEIQSSRHELAQLALGVEKMDAMIEMSRVMASPDYTLGMTYYQGREVDGTAGDGMDMEMDSTGFMTQPMIDYRQTGYPLEFAWSMELIDRRDAMQSMLDAKTDEALGMLAMLSERFNQAVDSEGVYAGQIIPDARAALSVVRTGYVADENNFNDLIASELSLLMADMDLANIRLDRRLALIEIERLIGKDLHGRNAQPE